MFHYIVGPIIGVTIFITSLVGLGSVIPDPTCADGWRSPSIGRQGACSHHGGVQEHPLQYAVFPISVVVGFMSYAFVEGLGFIQKGKEKTRKLREEELKRGRVLCPRCQSVMVVRQGPRGKFYGCSKFPRCKGNRSLKKEEKAHPDQ